jgi:hypothetical protein
MSDSGSFQLKLSHSNCCFYSCKTHATSAMLINAWILVRYMVQYQSGEQRVVLYRAQVYVAHVCKTDAE